MHSSPATEAISWKAILKTDCFTAKKRRFAMTAQSNKEAQKQLEGLGVIVRKIAA